MFHILSPGSFPEDVGLFLKYVEKNCKNKAFVKAGRALFCMCGKF